MMRFDIGRAREWAVLMVVVQVMMGTGMALMYGFFYPHMTQTTALYIATGTPTLALIPLGFVMVPANVGQQKLEGTFDFIWSLPVPRSAEGGGDLPALHGALPAGNGARSGRVLLAVRRSARAFPRRSCPATVLSALMAVSVGFGMALAISNPLLINLITNALIFVVLLFSPIVFPPATSRPGC